MKTDEAERLRERLRQLHVWACANVGMRYRDSIVCTYVREELDRSPETPLIQRAREQAAAVPKQVPATGATRDAELKRLRAELAAWLVGDDE